MTTVVIDTAATVAPGSAYTLDASLVTGAVESGNPDAVSGGEIKAYADFNTEIESLSINVLDYTKAESQALLFVGTVCEKKGVRQLVKALPMITY